MDSIFASILFLLSFIATLAAIFLLSPLALKVGLSDKPSHARKKHQGEIPLIGGLAIYLSVVIIQGFISPNNPAFIAAATLIVLLGVADDYKNIRFKARLIVESIAVLIMIKWGGVEITHLGNLLGGGELNLGILATPFTVFAVLGGINAFNMLDGIDGLAGSLSFGVFCLLLILSVQHNHSEIQFLCTVFIAATGAFLLFNLRLFGRAKASVFLGDAGSTLLGFTISCLLIIASQGAQNIIAPGTVLWLIAIPLFDTFSIMLRRVRKGKSPFTPDREHFHHILLVAGYSVNKTVAIIFLSSFFLGIVGIAADLLFDSPEWLLFYLFLGLFGLYMWGINHAWKVMKIARYLHEKNQKDRRSGLDRRKYDECHYQNGNRRTTGERRGGVDRRYHEAICALVKINKRKRK